MRSSFQASLTKVIPIPMSKKYSKSNYLDCCATKSKRVFYQHFRPDVTRNVAYKILVHRREQSIGNFFGQNACQRKKLWVICIHGQVSKPCEFSFDAKERS